MAIPIKLLIIEDSANDAELFAAELRSAGFEPKWKRVETEAGYRASLEELPDLIISDYRMPHFSGLRAVDLLHERGLDIPFILVSGAEGEEQAVEAMKHGVTDYLLKDRIGRLGNAVERALEQKRLRDERGRMQQQLAFQAMALSQLLEHSPAVIYALRVEGASVVPTLVSENITRLLGFTVTETLRYEWWVGQLHPEDRDKAIAGVSETLAHGASRTEYRLRHKNGDYRWVDDNRRVVYGPSNQPAKITGLWTDITERKQGEQALRESVEKFHQLAENINEVFWITDSVRNQMLYISPAYERIWGRTCDSLYQSPQSWLEAIHSDDRQRILEAAMAKQQLGEYDETYRIVRPDASVRWIHDRAFPVRTASGEVYRIVGTAEDITERKKLEEDLRKSEAELRVTFENAAIGVALVDAEGHCLKSNRALRQLLGYSKEELRGMVFTEFTHPDDVKADLTLWREMLSGVREHYQIEKRYLRKGGEVVHARLTASMVRGPAGKPQYAVGMVEDITEKKKLEAQFLRAQRMESLGTLAGGIAHDLNNVLAPILISCELLQMEEGDGDKRKLVGMIKGSAERGAELVKQVLSFASGIEGRRVAVQPKHLIREMANIACKTFPKSIRIRFNIANDVCMLLGDPTQLHQVLLNLCVNARDAMPTGGELTIAAENVLAGTSLPDIDQDAKPGAHVVIKVTDTGTGIPAEIRKRIFDPFFTTKEVGKGTGLGLSTSLGIVKSHGGFIRVHSQPGKGSTFEIWLPGKKAEELSAPRVEEVLLPRGHGELILVVDDEAFLRVMTSQTLEAYGYTVLTAANGADAVAIYSRNKDGIEVVLTDIMMPVMDGAALTLALRKINPTVRVIVASGLCDTEHHANAIRAGVKHFLPKPYHAERLLNSLYDILHEQKDCHPVPRPAQVPMTSPRG